MKNPPSEVIEERAYYYEGVRYTPYYRDEKFFSADGGVNPTFVIPAC